MIRSLRRRLLEVDSLSGRQQCRRCLLMVEQLHSRKKTRQRRMVATVRQWGTAEWRTKDWRCSLQAGLARDLTEEVPVEVA